MTDEAPPRLTGHQTPIRRQYLRVKQQVPGAILFFRLGDFYETFDADAELVAAALDIVLTGREMGGGQRIPMAGVPVHAAENYLARLVALGHRVAICEQVGAVTGRDLVQREVVRIVTPGTVTEPSMLDPAADNYLAAVLVDAGGLGLAYADLSTGEFGAAQFPSHEAATTLAYELHRLRPRELVVPASQDQPGPWAPPGAQQTPTNDRHWRQEAAREALHRHFGVTTLEAFGLADLPLATRAAGALLAYATDTCRGSLAQLRPPHVPAQGQTMLLDAQTVRNLELTASSRGARHHSLLHVLDATVTPLGARRLRRWLLAPLVRLEPLQARQEVVAALHGAPLARADMRAGLKAVADVERLTSRLLQGSIAPRELAALGASAHGIVALRRCVAESGLTALQHLGAALVDVQPVADLIAGALVPDPPALTASQPTIRPGFAPELDALRDAIRDSTEYLASLEQRERERTGLRGLRVGYNKVFGYYLEVARSQAERVPADFERKQTLVNAERYVTPELKQHEARVVAAEEQIQALEATVFARLLAELQPRAADLIASAAAAGELDAAASLAEVAARRRYCRPVLDDSGELDIVAGRHPVVEAVQQAEAFVPNDLRLSVGGRQLVLLTGPNMSGKSTYLRMAAQLVLMAQIGSFVPAASARVGLVDRIFTRVGAQDDIATGQSTFMVEMVETAAILHQATRQSLVVLDEIGRGTSTYDGLAVAQAVIEYLHNLPRLGCRTLFATHYHELTALAEILPHVTNARLDVLEEGNRVTFLRRVVDGAADRSYGLHVAGLAGIPRAVIQRATDILRTLEASGSRWSADEPSPAEPVFQLSFLEQPHPAVALLRSLDIDALSPLEAITRLYELRRLATEAGPPATPGDPTVR